MSTGVRVGWGLQGWGGGGGSVFASVTDLWKHHLCCPLVVEAVASLPRFKGRESLKAQWVGLET